jgi:DNA-binding transcriptional ArsR family regulator
MSRNWRNAFDRTRHEAQILLKLFESNKGLTFGELLDDTELSKPVLSQHLKSLSSPFDFRRIHYTPMVIQEGVGRSRRYKLDPKTREDIEEEGGIILVYPLPDKARSRRKAERYLKDAGQ